MEVHRDIITTNIRSHSNDRGLIELPYQMACRNAVQVGHDDIHEDKVIFGSSIHFVNGFQAIELRLLRGGKS